MSDPAAPLQPSPLVRKFAQTMVEAASCHPVIDVACGSGRNAAYLAQLGCTVICIDRDLTRLKSKLTKPRILDRLIFVQMDLLTDPWPIARGTVGGIVLVDFLDQSLFGYFERSLITGGHLLIETVSARGGNYLELPNAGALRTAFEKSFDFVLYRERHAGPRTSNAVTVRMLGRKLQRQGPYETLSLPDAAATGRTPGTQRQFSSLRSMSTGGKFVPSLCRAAKCGIPPG
jgi:SAM-dependent methyltransferase